VKSIRLFARVNGWFGNDLDGTPETLQEVHRPPASVSASRIPAQRLESIRHALNYVAGLVYYFYGKGLRKDFVPFERILYV